MLCFGRSNYFRFNHPEEAKRIKESTNNRRSFTSTAYLPQKTGKCTKSCCTYWIRVLRRKCTGFATAQGKQEKQGIWKSIFPDRENTGNLLKNIKNMFLHREFTTNTENLSVLKKKKKRTCSLSGWNYPLAVLCQDLGLYVILAAVLSWNILSLCHCMLVSF